ncbi:hypothetical protein JL720_15311 [Aureococcus anophagefferens]|nr:hypothetical protein JL720_15311 [Aureococcus anophagefferens]
MTPNPMRSEAAAPAQDLSLLSDAVVNELLREKGLSLDARIEFLCKRVAAPPVPQNAWHILDFVPLVNVLRAVFFKRVPAPDQVKDKMNMLCLFVEEKGSCSHTEWDPDFGTTKFPDARLFRDSWGNFENFYMSMCFFAISFSSICVSYGTFAATRDTKTMPEPSRKIVARQRTASGPRRDSGTADAPAGGNWFTARIGRARFGETVCL